MMGPWYRSAMRGMRTDARVPAKPSVSSPVGADDDTTYAGQTAAAQAAAMRGQRAPMQQQPEAEIQPDILSAIPSNARSALLGGYAAGGFEGVRNAAGAENWYDLPESTRRAILSRMTAGA